jgi:hypothetical protein
MKKAVLFGTIAGSCMGIPLAWGIVLLSRLFFDQLALFL